MINNISNSLPLNATAFKGHDEKSDKIPPYYVSGKNNLPAVASFILPGIGEQMNDQPNKNSMLAWGVGLTATRIVSGLSMYEIDKTGIIVPSNSKFKAFVAATSFLALLYLRFKSAIQTYKYNPEMEYRLKNKTHPEPKTIKQN